MRKHLGLSHFRVYRNPFDNCTYDAKHV